MTDFTRMLLGNAVSIVLAIVLLRVTQKRLAQPSWRLLAGLIGLELLLINLHMWAWGDVHQFFRWFFNLDVELTLGSMFSSAQLLAIGLVGALLIINVRGGFARLYWASFAAWFIFLSLDEYFALHEKLDPNTFIIVYLLIGVALAGLTVLAWRTGGKKHTLLYVLLLIGFFAFGVGGLAIESGTLLLADRFPWVHQVWLVSIVLEEFLEMASASLVLVVALTFLQKNGTTLKPTRLALIFASWLLVLIAYVWLLPTVLFNRNAIEVSATYTEDALTLVGYTLPTQVVQPGDVLNIETFWQAQDFLAAHYTFSLHALTQPDQQSIAQMNVVGSDYNVSSVDYPSGAWLPNRIVRVPLQLEIPTDLEDARSYLLNLSVGTTDQPLGVAQTDLAMLDPASVVLNYIASPEAQLGDVPTAGLVQFTDDAISFSLPDVQRQLPTMLAAGDAFTLDFVWNATAAPPRDLIQFIHLISKSDGTVYNVDRAPFDQQYPVSQWVPNSVSVDSITFPIPTDALAGEYDIYTGLYEWPALERAAVVNTTGEAYVNRTIPLGTLSITAP